jgi:hypothetical protein
MVGGWLLAPLIKRELRGIFTYRHQALLAHFKQPEPRTPPRILFG